MPWVRYALPAYPFLAIVAGSSLKEFKGIYGNLIVVILLLWFVVGTLKSFPHFISYANELAGARSTRYQQFADSNIDWGQSLPDLQGYVDKKKPKHFTFSYFGRDNGNDYGLVSNRPYGSYKFEEICAFHEIDFPQNAGERLVAISASNWHACGFSNSEHYRNDKVIDVVGDSVLIFR